MTIRTPTLKPQRPASYEIHNEIWKPMGIGAKIKRRQKNMGKAIYPNLNPKNYKKNSQTTYKEPYGRHLCARARANSNSGPIQVEPDRDLSE
jgi:hypothetical protein